MKMFKINYKKFKDKIILKNVIICNKTYYLTCLFYISLIGFLYNNKLFDVYSLIVLIPFMCFSYIYYKTYRKFEEFDYKIIKSHFIYSAYIPRIRNFFPKLIEKDLVNVLPINKPIKIKEFIKCKTIKQTRYQKFKQFVNRIIKFKRKED